MTTIATFRDFIKPYCHQCPNAIIDAQILETLIIFCRDTLVLELEATAISILEDTAEYTPVFSSGSYKSKKIVHALLGDGTDDDESIRVTSEWYLNQTGPNWKRHTTSGNFSYVFLTMDGNIRVYPVPDADLDDELRVRLVVEPKNDATEIDDIIYNDHRTAIRAGVLSEILSIKGKLWWNETEAMRRTIEYERLKADARGLSRQGNGNVSMVGGYTGSTMF